MKRSTRMIPPTSRDNGGTASILSMAGRVFAVMALVLISQSLQRGVSAKEKTTPPHDGYAVSGLTLGADVTDFEAAFPDAEVTIHEVDRFCYGRRVVLDELNWATAVSTHDSVAVRAKFHQSNRQFQLTKLIRTEAIDFRPADVADLSHDLVARYGPYTRMLTRRKMEPAGRIIGFEWTDRDDERLSVIIREDHATNSGKILIETRLTTPSPGPDTVRSGTTSNIAADKAFQEQCPKPVN